MIARTTLLVIPVTLLGCFRPPPPSAAATAPKDTRGQLVERARAVLGVAPTQELVVSGPERGTIQKLEVQAGRCYDIAVATDPAIHSAIEIQPGMTLLYPAPRVAGSDPNDVSGAGGRSLSVRFCADMTGAVHAVLTSVGAVNPFASPFTVALGPMRPYALAIAHAPEGAEARAKRHEIERTRFREAERAKCDELPTSSAAFDCLEQLEAKLQRLDERRAELPVLDEAAAPVGELSSDASAQGASL